MKAAELAARAEYCRDLARRARRMVNELTRANAADRARLERYISELEAEAATLEQQAAITIPASAPALRAEPPEART
jgi:hypothetical protein